MDGLLQDATRPGRPRTARQAANVEQVVRITLEQTPKGATHWSTRTLAAHLGTSASAVARISGAPMASNPMALALGHPVGHPVGLNLKTSVSDVQFVYESGRLRYSMD